MKKDDKDNEKRWQRQWKEMATKTSTEIKNDRLLVQLKFLQTRLAHIVGLSHKRFWTRIISQIYFISNFSFALYFLSIFSLACHFLAGRLPACRKLCHPVMQTNYQLPQVARPTQVASGKENRAIKLFLLDLLDWGDKIWKADEREIVKLFENLQIPRFHFGRLG